MTNTSPALMVAAAGSTRPGTLRDVLTDYGHRLVGAHVFSVRRADVPVLAATIGLLAVTADDGDALRERATAVRDGWWGGWATDPAAVAAALDTAADVLDAL